MTLRISQKSDASSIAALSIEAWIGTYLKRGVSAFFADYVLDEFTSAKTEALLSDPNEFFMISQREEGIDGFIRVTFGSQAPVKGCSEVEISTFYVQLRHQGKGVGKRLLNAALQHCRDNGEGAVWLTVNVENTHAISFYLTQGFDYVGETQFRIEDQAFLNNIYSYHFE